MTVDPLVSRWLTEEGRKLAVDSAFRLVAGESFAGSLAGFHEGRVDLRGFSFPSPDQVARVKVGRIEGVMLSGLIELRGVAWVGLDLSKARLQSLRFFDSTVSDCVFDGAICPDWRIWSTKVENSSFVRTTLSDSALGTPQDGGNTWSNVRFERADLRGSGYTGSLFSGCVFDRCRLGAASFNRCELVDVTFIGPMRRTLFDGRDISESPPLGPLKEVDFSGAVFDDVEFRGCEFENVIFPKTQSFILIDKYPAVQRKQLQMLADDPSALARSVVNVTSYRLEGPQNENAMGVFSHADRAKSWDESYAGFLEESLLLAAHAIGVEVTRLN